MAPINTLALMSMSRVSARNGLVAGADSDLVVAGAETRVPAALRRKRTENPTDDNV